MLKSLTKQIWRRPHAVAPAFDEPWGFFVHGIHKSGTMFLYNFFKELAADRGLAYFSSNNSTANEADFTNCESSFCVCPVRTYDLDCKPISSDFQVARIVHVRDPRDTIVSEYFSFGWSHKASADNSLDGRQQEIQQMTIDEYVLGQPEFSSQPIEARLAPLLTMDFDERCILVTYEEMVTDFANWVAKVLPPFQFAHPEREVRRLAKKYRQEFKASNDPTAHKRNITPGDHKRKLQPETIEALNERYSDFLTRFGYL